MARPDVTLLVDGDLRPFEKRVQRSVNTAQKTVDKLNTRGAQLALGTISRDAQKFSDSLASANSRVIAFGASVAVIEGVRRAFSSLVRVTVEVEKNLADIQVILKASVRDLSLLSNELFNIAKNTGQAFQVAADAAKEFARQGLTLEQTLKRTEAALINLRLSGLSAGESVQFITATLNSFKGEISDVNLLISKAAAVDAAFAVSLEDLAKGFSRSAAAARQSGVSIDELNGLITAAQQITARGGAVIGNGLKTIFTRLQRSTTIDQLKELGVQIDSTQSGVQKLQALASAVQQVDRVTGAQIKELAAGVFQINTLSAILGDLSSQYSIFENAVQSSNRAVDEAITRNAELNTTLAALGNETLQNVNQVFAKLGEAGGKGAIRSFLSEINNLFEALQGNAAKSQNINPLLRGISDAFFSISKAVSGSGITSGVKVVEGLVNILSGPGLIAGLTALGNIISKTIRFAGQSLISLTGINREKNKEKQTQIAINALLQNATVEERRRFAAAKTLAAQERQILSILEAQLAVQARFNASGALLASSSAIRASNLAVSPITQQFSGRVRSGASGILPAISKEQSAINSGVGGASVSAQPKVISDFNFGGGRIGPAVVNSDEVLVKNFAGGNGTAVFNQDMIKEAGGISNLKKFGNVENVAKGKIPNFALSTFEKGELTKILKSGQPLPPKFRDELFRLSINPGLFRARQQGLLSQGNVSEIIRRGGVNNLISQSQGDISAQRISGSGNRPNQPIPQNTRGTVSATPASRRPFDPNAVLPPAQEEAFTQRQIRAFQKTTQGRSASGFFGLRNFNKESESFINKRSLGNRAASGNIRNISQQLQQQQLSRQLNSILGLSLAASFLGPTIGDSIGGAAGKRTSGALQGGATGASLGLLFGPKGAAIGGLGGAVGGALLTDTRKSIEDLSNELQNLQGQFSSAGNAINNYTQTQAQFNQLLESGNFNQLQVNNFVRNLQDSIQQIISSGIPGSTDIARRLGASRNDQERLKIANDFRQLQTRQTARQEVPALAASLLQNGVLDPQESKQLAGKLFQSGSDTQRRDALSAIRNIDFVRPKDFARSGKIFDESFEIEKNVSQKEAFQRTFDNSGAFFDALGLSKEQISAFRDRFKDSDSAFNDFVSTLTKFQSIVSETDKIQSLSNQLIKLQTVTVNFTKTLTSINNLRTFRDTISSQNNLFNRNFSLQNRLNANELSLDSGNISNIRAFDVESSLRRQQLRNRGDEKLNQARLGATGRVRNIFSESGVQQDSDFLKSFANNINPSNIQSILEDQDILSGLNPTAQNELKQINEKLAQQTTEIKNGNNQQGKAFEQQRQLERQLLQQSQNRSFFGGAIAQANQPQNLGLAAANVSSLQGQLSIARTSSERRSIQARLTEARRELQAQSVNERNISGIGISGGNFNVDRNQRIVNRSGQIASQFLAGQAQRGGLLSGTNRLSGLQEVFGRAFRSSDDPQQQLQALLGATNNIQSGGALSSDEATQLKEGLREIFEGGLENLINNPQSIDGVQNDFSDLKTIQENLITAFSEQKEQLASNTQTMQELTDKIEELSSSVKERIITEVNLSAEIAAQITQNITNEDLREATTKVFDTLFNQKQASGEIPLGPNSTLILPSTQ